MQARSVSDVMNRGVISCTEDALVPDIARTMTRRDISAIVVVNDDGYLTGLISRTDLATLYGFDEMWPHLTAGQIMSRQVHTVAPDVQASEAAKQLHQHKISRLIVTEGEDATHLRPVGVLSITDIVREMSNW